MKVLIVEDDFMSRTLMIACLSHLGECHVAVNGKEAVEAFNTAVLKEVPYDLVTLDIMMPEMDGQSALKAMRAIEDEHESQLRGNAKIVMTTALKDCQNVMGAFKNQCDGYLVKPITFEDVQNIVDTLGLGG